MPARPLPSVFIPDGESQFALYAATCLGRTGHRVHVLSSAGSARIRFSRHCASFTANAAEAPPAEKLGVALRIIERAGETVVLPVAEAAALWAIENRAALARVARVVDLPDPNALAVASDKARLATFMKQHGIPHPETRSVSRGGDIAAAAKGLAFPLLWKPTHGSGGRAIVRLSDPAALAAFAVFETTEAGVVQEEIPGADWDSSALCREGQVLAMTVQHPLPFGARGFAPPTAVVFEEDDEVREVTGRLMKVLGWSGIANLDLRRDARDGRVRVIEINPRYWSSLLGSCAAGVHFPHLACMAAMGTQFAPPRQRARRYVQAGTALRLAIAASSAERTAIAETTLPGLLSDPLPFLWGRIGRNQSRSPSDGRRAA